MTPNAARRGRRVAVTGLGAVSAWGWGVEAFWEGLLHGRTAIGAFGRFDHRAFPTHVAAEVPPAPAAVRRDHPNWRRLSVADRFAVAAAAEALRDAGFGDRGLGPTVGIYFASSTGGMLEGEEFFGRVLGASPGRPRPGDLAVHPVSSPGEAVARRFAAEGPVITISSACASGTLALGAALDALRHGEVELALAGGSDSLCRTTFGGFNALRSVDAEPCRPFRAGRAGLSLGEGAAVIVLEPWEAAVARGVRPLAELAGAGATGDAHHMTAPHPDGEGAARALTAALADAGLPAASIDFVNAHGTGTPLNDVAEWRALAAVFGARAAAMPVTSTKASVGHLLGSAGAAEAVATVLGLDRGAVHPTPGGDRSQAPLDSETPVFLITGEPLPLPEARAAASINLAFGGCNAAVVFARGEAR